MPESRKDVQLIDIQINCDRLYSEQKPEDIAFMYLCERTNDLVRAQQSIGMLIGDRESDQTAARYATSLSSYRDKGTTFAHGRDIKNLVDSVHFTSAHLSRFLQLADVYVWLRQFKNRNRGSEDIRHKALFDLLSQRAVDLSPSKYKTWPLER
jgi:DNA-binding protein